MDLPIEIINLILHHAQFKELDSELLKLRLISQHWKDAVEDFCARKKSLILENDLDYHQVVRCRRTTINTSTVYARFFGAVNVESSLLIKVRYPITLADHNLTRLILKLFPNVEQLIYKAALDHHSVVTNLIFLLSHWKNISTLSFERSINYKHQTQIASMINSFEKLIRLDFGQYFNICLLFPTLKHIQHLSLGFCFPSYSIFRDVICQIGPDCSRLWIGGVQKYSKMITCNELLSWKTVNADLCNHLTHFGCSAFNSEGAEIISAHFPLLHTMYINVYYNYDSIAQMGHISNLRELHFLEGILGTRRLPEISIENTRPMENVHTFEFRSTFRWRVENVEIFCIRLARLLPNVKHLTMVFNDFAEVEMVEKNLSMFRNLCTYRVK